MHPITIFQSEVLEGSGSLQLKALIAGEWIIVTEIECCLRLLGIVMNEPVTTTISIKPFSPAENTIAGFHIAFGSFITTPQGRVHAVAVKIIPAADRF